MSAKHQVDIEHAQKLHGDVDPKLSFVNKVVSKDKQLAEEQYESYKAFWDERRTGEEEECKLAGRQENYTTLVNTYYNLSTDLYEYGWGTSFHFARMYKDEPLAQSIARHQHFLALQLQLKPGMKVLDVGCGVGGPAREMIRFFRGSHYWIQ
ncbi:Delta(24)-sterol C-methyltransferase [Entomophthora muscae]|uniref:Delta(24)-sterol C-methyltransferase n=1 Tax=Entomophthora muscae TaxID=34485 RepID=A0ACC2T4C2_9FUNG|nr:Delta(24)-sterol C-methyltransferase [Entomophthora muscae]